jgi:hypothetical protein
MQGPTRRLGCSGFVSRNCRHERGFSARGCVFRHIEFRPLRVCPVGCLCLLDIPFGSMGSGKRMVLQNFMMTRH